MAFQNEDYLQLTHCLLQIKPLLLIPSLNLEQQASLIENVRKMTLILVEAVHVLDTQKADLIRINKQLLGYVLSIPRLDEPTEEDMIVRALHQISCISVAAEDIQIYLRKNIILLKDAIEANK
ncbi:MAG: hypothetical protein ACRCY4_10595 [Brevinema sp.]